MSQVTEINEKYWRFRLLLGGLGTVLLWVLAQDLAFSFITHSSSFGWAMLFSHLGGLIALVLCMLNHNFRHAVIGKTFVQLPPRRFFVIAVALVISIYALAVIYCRIKGVPLEPFMLEAISQSGYTSWFSFVLVTMVVAPIAEEIVFRGVILRAFSFKDTFKWKLLGVVVSTIVFVLVHQQYEHMSTFVLIAIGAFAMGIARVVTDGLAIPIAMHMTASGCAWLFYAIPAILIEQ